MKEQKPDIEIQILQSLSAGLTQEEISMHFKKMGITPNSVSIIEKKIKSMKKEYRAGNLFQLALIVKRKGLI
jgi:transcriptional regulator